MREPVGVFTIAKDWPQRGAPGARKMPPTVRCFIFCAFRVFLRPLPGMLKKSNPEEESPKKIASYTVKLDDAQMEKLRAICVARGWTPFEVAYTRFAFKADHLKVNVS